MQNDFNQFYDTFADTLTLIKVDFIITFCCDLYYFALTKASDRENGPLNDDMLRAVCTFSHATIEKNNIYIQMGKDGIYSHLLVGEYLIFKKPKKDSSILWRLKWYYLKFTFMISIMLT